MSEDFESSHSLSIRCPACRQRFNVEDELMGQMVECGACDASFKITDEVIIHSKRFYPGERGNLGLDRFRRVPLASAPAPKGMQTVQYAEFKHPEQLGPASPVRVIAGIAGAALILITGLLFLLSGTSGGMFSGLALSNKLIVACFASVVGFALLVYANPRARLKAGFFGLLLAAGVISIPFYQKDNESTRRAERGPIETAFNPTDSEDVAAESDDLESRFGTKPLEIERERLKTRSGTGNVYGVYLTNMVERNIYSARDYLFRETGAHPSSHSYPRNRGDYLMLLTGVEGDLNSVARVAAQLGEVEETHPDMGLLVIKVNNDLFVAASADKVNNQSDPEFYLLNMRELGSIDLDRVERAVDRLALAKPSIFQGDISRMLVELMGKPGVRFHGSIARALLIWGAEPGPAGGAALKIVRKYTAEGTPVPEPLVDLVIKEQTVGAAPAIRDLWILNPNLWQSRYTKFGSVIEEDVLAQVNAENQALRRSALTILEEVGTEKSLPALRTLGKDSEPSIRVLAERALTKIGTR